jgi:hypothetical protein
MQAGRTLVVLAVALVIGATPMPPEAPQSWESLANASAGVSAARREDTQLVAVADLGDALGRDLEPPPIPPQASRPRATSTHPAKLLALARSLRLAQGPPASLL